MARSESGIAKARRSETSTVLVVIFDDPTKPIGPFYRKELA